MKKFEQKNFTNYIKKLYIVYNGVVCVFVCLCSINILHSPETKRGGMPL